MHDNIADIRAIYVQVFKLHYYKHSSRWYKYNTSVQYTCPQYTCTQPHQYNTQHWYKYTCPRCSYNSTSTPIQLHISHNANYPSKQGNTI